MKKFAQTCQVCQVSDSIGVLYKICGNPELRLIEEVVDLKAPSISPGIEF
jgi:hypothetical protein